MSYIRFTSKQKLFDHVVIGLAAQGWRQAANNGSCMYRAPNGDKCAVGQCIPDEAYERGMEGGTIHDDDNSFGGKESPREKRIREAAGIPVKLRDFAKQMQRIHDTADYANTKHIGMKDMFKVLGIAHSMSLSQII